MLNPVTRDAAIPVLTREKRKPMPTQNRVCEYAAIVNDGPNAETIKWSSTANGFMKGGLSIQWNIMWP